MQSKIDISTSEGKRYVMDEYRRQVKVHPRMALKTFCRYNGIDEHRSLLSWARENGLDPLDDIREFAYYQSFKCHVFPAAGTRYRQNYGGRKGCRQQEE